MACLSTTRTCAWKTVRTRLMTQKTKRNPQDSSSSKHLTSLSRTWCRSLTVMVHGLCASTTSRTRTPALSSWQWESRPLWTHWSLMTTFSPRTLEWSKASYGKPTLVSKTNLMLSRPALMSLSFKETTMCARIWSMPTLCRSSRSAFQHRIRTCSKIQTCSSTLMTRSMRYRSRRSLWSMLRCRFLMRSSMLWRGFRDGILWWLFRERLTRSREVHDLSSLLSQGDIWTKSLIVDFYRTQEQATWSRTMTT